VKSAIFDERPDPNKLFLDWHWDKLGGYCCFSLGEPQLKTVLIYDAETRRAGLSHSSLTLIVISPSIIGR
jgi:hypothetical protein